MWTVKRLVSLSHNTAMACSLETFQYNVSRDVSKCRQPALDVLYTGLCKLDILANRISVTLESDGIAIGNLSNPKNATPYKFRTETSNNTVTMLTRHPPRICKRRKIS